MSESLHQDVPESPEERMLRRRARRWKRRARIVGPFLGVTVLVATLALSVDLIEYQPQPEQNQSSNRPLPDPLAQQQQNMDRSLAKSVATTSVVTADPRMIGGENLGLDVTLTPVETGTDAQLEQDLAAPANPYVLRGRR